MGDVVSDVDDGLEWVRLATIYQDVFIPVAGVLRRREVDHQLEIYNELRNAVAHLAWSTLPEADRPHQIRSAYRHIARACLDSAKLLHENHWQAVGWSPRAEGVSFADVLHRVTAMNASPFPTGTVGGEDPLVRWSDVVADISGEAQDWPLPQADQRYRIHAAGPEIVAVCRRMLDCVQADVRLRSLCARRLDVTLATYRWIMDTFVSWLCLEPSSEDPTPVLRHELDELMDRFVTDHAEFTVRTLVMNAQELPAADDLPSGVDSGRRLDYREAQARFVECAEAIVNDAAWHAPDWSERMAELDRDFATLVEVHPLAAIRLDLDGVEDTRGSRPRRAIEALTAGEADGEARRYVVFADLVDSTGPDGAVATEAFYAAIRFAAHVAQQGRGLDALNTWGDALVAVFGSQRGLARFFAEFARHCHPRNGQHLRLGLASGSVDFLDNPVLGADPTGETVFLAARLEASADSDSVIVLADDPILPDLEWEPASVVAKKSFTGERCIMQAGQTVEVKRLALADFLDRIGEASSAAS